MGGAMPEREGIVAIGLLTQDDLKRLGTGFDRAFRVDETPCFGELLREIDDADRKIERQQIVQNEK